MHGWISLPSVAYYIFILVAPLIGAAVRACVGHSKRRIIWWPVVSLCYSIGVVATAFLYEVSKHPGRYDMRAWASLVPPVLVFALPAIGLGWVAASYAIRSSPRS
jgi:hypothetical protein